MLKLSLSRTPLPPPQKGEKPFSIQAAIGCLEILIFCHGCTALWGISLLFINLRAPASIFPYIFILAAIVLLLFLPFIVTYWLTDKIKQRKNWARITYTILALLSCVITGYADYLNMMRDTSTPPFIYFMGTVLSFFPLLSLYRKDSNEWFKQAAQA